VIIVDKIENVRSIVGEKVFEELKELSTFIEPYFGSACELFALLVQSLSVALSTPSSERTLILFPWIIINETYIDSLKKLCSIVESIVAENKGSWDVKIVSPNPISGTVCVFPNIKKLNKLVKATFFPSFELECDDDQTLSECILTLPIRLREAP